MRKLLVALALFLAPTLAHGQDFQRLTAFGEGLSADLTNVISLQSTFGTSTLRDVVSTTDTGAVGLDGGYIELTTGTGATGAAEVATVDRGQYQPGKGAEVGIGARLVAPPSAAGESAEWGLGDGDNGVFLRYHDQDSDGTFELCFVYETGGNETVACEGGAAGNGGFNRDGLAGVDPTTGTVWVIRFVWYGVGGAELWAYSPDSAANGTLNAQLVHSYTPADGQAMEDPNQPIFASVTGAGTNNVEMEIGGRRYDIQGKFNPPKRQSFERRVGVTVGTTYEPLICVRREDPFPAAGRQNSVNAFIAALVLAVSTQDVTIAYATVDAADLTGASFATASAYADADTALEYDTSATAITNYTVLAGGYTFEAGSNSGATKGAVLDNEKGKRVPLIRNDPTCAIARADASTATVDATMRVREEW